jgi:hypothetical protein
MRWKNVAIGLAVVLSATACLAEMPNFSADPSAMSVLQRGQLMTGQNWWTRFGEPVNTTALAQIDVSPSDKGVVGAPMPIYGDGYAFGLGACDCPPPCIWDLWSGYYQHPHRCHDGHFLRGRCRRCGHFGRGCGCGQCNKGCQSCAKPACGCHAPVTCSAPAPSCGCKPVCGKCRKCHLGWHGFAAHWNKPCCSCARPLGCGCTTPTFEIPPGAEKLPIGNPPVPILDEAALHPLPRIK